jgi:hypothetical protein
MAVSLAQQACRLLCALLITVLASSAWVGGARGAEPNVSSPAKRIVFFGGVKTHSPARFATPRG